MSILERVAGCLKGLATGDAIGKQTEMLALADVRKWYPQRLRGFEGRPGQIIPRYAGKRYEWRIGETTDDTEQTLAVARALVRQGRASHRAIGEELLRCKKSLHPGVSLWAFVQTGDPARMASEGDGCGAAMRSAPVGVLYPTWRLEELIQGAYECAIPTHGGQLAIGAAAAVAGAVSAALEGRSAAEILDAALVACEGAERLRPPGEGIGARISMRESIETTYSDLAARKHLAIDELAQQYFPDRPRTIVPLAISLALVTGSAEETALLAANLGGDADSVASIGGAVAGAYRPETVNEAWFAVVRAVNPDDLIEVAGLLAGLRQDKLYP